MSGKKCIFKKYIKQIEDVEFHRLRKNHEEAQERLENYIKDNF